MRRSSPPRAELRSRRSVNVTSERLHLCHVSLWQHRLGGGRSESRNLHGAWRRGGNGGGGRPENRSLHTPTAMGPEHDAICTPGGCLAHDFALGHALDRLRQDGRVGLMRPEMLGRRLEYVGSTARLFTDALAIVTAQGGKSGMTGRREWIV